MCEATRFVRTLRRILETFPMLAQRFLEKSAAAKYVGRWIVVCWLADLLRS